MTNNNQNLSLLEQAKSKKVRQAHKNTITDEELELAVSWAKGEVTLTQILAVLTQYKSQTQIYGFLAHSFRRYIMNEDKTNSKNV